MPLPDITIIKAIIKSDVSLKEGTSLFGFSLLFHH